MNRLLLTLSVVTVFSGSVFGQVKDSKRIKEPTNPNDTEVWQPKPKVVTVDARTGIPSDAIVLFNGENFDEWVSSNDSSAVNWILNADKSMTVKDKAGDIQTKRNFGDIQLHIEWKSPKDIHGVGQHRGNSGVFLQNRYEVQVLDNNGNDTYVNGQVGAIYKQAIPLVKASSKTGDWNVYDIIYHAPKFDESGNKTKSGTITVLHNGVLIQDHKDNSGVSYRNIWVRELN